MTRRRAFLTLQHGNSTPLGTLHIELYDDTAPKTVHNFCQLLQQQGPPKDKEGYRGSLFHRIIPGFMAQGGDFTHGDGTGGTSIYGKTFDDENFIHKHERAGTLSMANAGPNTNGSQFFITFRPTPHLDQKHVVFGHVDLRSSADTLHALESVRTDANDRPLQPVTIVDCGVLPNREEEEEKAEKTANENVDQKQQSTLNQLHDDDEIDIDEIDIDDDDKQNKDKTAALIHVNPAADDDSNKSNDDDDEMKQQPKSPKNKAEALKLRMRKLKQKMNQARQLNQKAVKEEGERITGSTGGNQERYQQKARAKQAQEAQWQAQHKKALVTAQQAGLTTQQAKELVQSAATSLEKAQHRAEKAEANLFSTRDYYNPEGQYRNYERNVSSLLRGNPSSSISTATFDPLEASRATDLEQERQGAHRLASELHRRIEKKKQKELKRQLQDDEQGNADGSGGVSHINKRNRHFNEKIRRNYDEHTAEIRQNLERGTAL